MELRQLEHFAAVAETHSFTRAAERLRISQPGLSASIRSLERDLGTALLERTTRRTILTPAGAALLGSARRVLDEVDAVRRRLADIAGLSAGSLALGVVQTFTSVDVPALLAELSRRHPGIQVTLREEPTAELLRSVLAGDLDLAFAALDNTPLPDGLMVARSYPEKIVVITGHDHPLAGRTRVRLESLGAERFIDFRAGQGLQTVIDDVCAAAGLHRRIGFAVSDMEQVLSLVSHGLGVALVPEPLARNSGLPVIAISPHPPARTLALVSRAAPPANPAARELLDLVPPTGSDAVGGR
ncbi:LysR family transcriptional regulator [Flexivirga sp. B27]